MDLVKTVCKDHRGRKVTIISPSPEDLWHRTREEKLEAKRLNEQNYRAFHPPDYVMDEIVGGPK